jgi:hypothetical protein
MKYYLVIAFLSLLLVTKAYGAHTVTPDPAFSGWWKMELRGSERGFGLGALTDDIDSYVFIDLSTFNPVTNPYVTIPHGSRNAYRALIIAKPGATLGLSRRFLKQ